jgi:hypothetical protein
MITAVKLTSISALALGHHSAKFASASTLGSRATAPTCLPAYAPKATYEGCYTDSSLERSLAGAMITSNENTPESCALQCGLQGYSYSGVEWATYVSSNLPILAGFCDHISNSLRSILVSAFVVTQSHRPEKRPQTVTATCLAQAMRQKCAGRMVGEYLASALQPHDTR